MREREIERLNKVKDHHEGKISRLIGRIQDRNIKRLLSDDEDESDGEYDWVKEIDDTEFKYVKAQLRQFKAQIKKFVRAFNEKHKRLPTDAETGPIAMQLADFNNAKAKFYEMKLTLIKQKKMPFDATEFSAKGFDGESIVATEEAPIRPMSTMDGRQKFLDGLVQGGVEKNVNETTIMEIAYHEARVTEMTAEIDALRKQIATKQGQSLAVQNFVDQLTTKDALIIEKDKKLYELSNQHNAIKKERRNLEEKMKNLQATNKLQKERVVAGVKANTADFDEVLRANLEVDRVRLENDDLRAQIRALSRLQAIVQSFQQCGKTDMTTENKILHQLSEKQSRIFKVEKAEREQIRKEIAQLRQEQYEYLLEKALKESEAEKDENSERFEKMTELIRDFIAELDKKTKRIEQLEDTREEQAANYKDQITKVQLEFNRITETSLMEAEKLQRKIDRLTDDLNKANAQIAKVDPHQEEIQKREMEQIKKRLESDLEKAKIKIEKLSQQLKVDSRTAAEYEEEVIKLRAQYEDMS